MRLNSIKLSGFKSFAEPTNFQLPGQLVGVVGPNGCGKSNIMDAVRWVLGESKASELRGESMQDVIFNGSGNRKPASRSSVELVFDNADARAGGQWNQFAEIAVKRVEEAPASFHARHDAESRSYLYQIATRKTAFSKKYVWWIKEPLDVPLMSRAAKMLVGRHDFRCFRAEDPTKPDDSTIVVVESAEIDQEPGLIVFRIEASHFLWRMVRRIVGVLVKLGLHEIAMADFERLLAAQCGGRLDVAAWTAPASGLFLERVNYRPSHES